MKSAQDRVERRATGAYGLAAAVLISLAAYGGLASLEFRYGTLVKTATWEMLAWTALAFAGYLGALLACERARHMPSVVLWGGAAAFHLLMLLTAPTLSSDVYRYLWDGHVANHGVSPYTYAIQDPALDALDAPVRVLSNNPWMASPYLPAAQWLFGTVTWLLPMDVKSMQAVMIGVNLLVGALIAALLAIARLPSRRLMLYLWNPLVVIETAHGAHVDVWMALLTMLALWLWLRVDDEENARVGAQRQRWLAPVVLALATLTKLLPGLLVLVLFWRWRWRRLLLYAATTTLLLTAAGLRAGWGLTGPLDGRGLFGALRIYAVRWNYNSGLFHWLETWPWLCSEIAFGAGECRLWAKSILAVMMVASMVAIWRMARSITSARALLRLAAAPLMFYVLLTTTVHPWYLLLLLAFLPFLAPGDDEPARQWGWVAPWLYLSATLFLSYLTYLDLDNLREYEWVRLTEWLPVWGMLAFASLVWMLSRIRLRGLRRIPLPAWRRS
jgi:hypothetical protein